MISPENLLKPFANKSTNKDTLCFQFTSTSGKLPTLKDTENYNLSLTRLGRKRKLPMQEPIETVIRAYQNFEIVDERYMKE